MATQNGLNDIDTYRYSYNKFANTYYHLILRTLNLRRLPKGNKLEWFGAEDWKDAELKLRSLKGFSETPHADGLRLELINASLPIPERFHWSNLQYGKRFKQRRLREVKEAAVTVRQIERVVEVIDLLSVEMGNRISAKKLHVIARKALNMQPTEPIVNLVRIIMTAKGWKAWQTYEGCWYERA